jgi:ABC-2 type transport system permease protein
MWSGAQLELHYLRRSKTFLALVLLEAVTFLVLVSLFGLTGSKAPTAIIDRDNTPASRAFVHYLDQAHRSFRLETMSREQADAKMNSGTLVARIIVPRGFGTNVLAHRTVDLPLVVDNVDTDFTNDIRRALPSAIAAFGQHLHQPGIRAIPVERDDINHDTDYISYLIVSALVLDALVLAGVLAATAVAREWEEGTIEVWSLSPARAVALLGGKILASALAASAGIAVALAIVVAGYGVVPKHWAEAIAVLLACVLIFACLGACLGALLRRTLPVVSIAFGAVMPLYIVSGSLEPLRFDGEQMWHIGHYTPTYWAIGVLEHAFHGLHVTPESVPTDALAMGLWAVGALALAIVVMNASRVTRTTPLDRVTRLVDRLRLVAR